ncbi:MAG: hypothetical protein AABX34_05345 [Nanoarchaeota archaeon]
MVQYKILCKKCKKFFMVYPFHSGSCEDCKKKYYERFNSAKK